MTEDWMSQEDGALLGDILLTNFNTLSKEGQVKKLILAGNAEFVINQLKKQTGTTEVDKACHSLLEALERYT